MDQNEHFYLLVLFPDGHLPSRRWRVVAWLYGGALAVGLATAAVQPGTTVVFIGDLCRSARSGWAAAAPLAGVARQQLKWLARTYRLDPAGQWADQAAPSG